MKTVKTSHKRPHATRSPALGKAAAATAAAPSAVTEIPPFFRNSRLQSILIFAFAFLLYANTLGHQWAQDDTVVITDNMFTQRGFAGIPDIFSKDTFFGYFKQEGKAGVVSGGRYRPLTPAMFAIVYQLFGKDPLPFHLLTVTLFAFACLLLYRTLLLLLRDNRGQGYAVLAAWMATLLFAAHPIHTEVVANVKGSDEIVTLLGSLGALFWTIKAFASGKAEYRFFAASSLFLGLLAKENAVAFLAVIPLALVFFRGAGVGSIVRFGWPLLAAFAAFFAMRLTVLPELFSKPPLELLNNPYLTWTGGRWVDFTAAEKLATIVYTLGKYVQLLFAPVTLTHDYYPRHIDVKHFSDPAVLGSLAFYLLLACYALVGPSKGKRDLLRFGILSYLLTLSIVSNLMFPIGTHMGERFLFMPSIGFCLAATALLLRLSRSERGFDCRRIGLPLGLVVVVAALFSLRTISRNQDWYDNRTLFFHDVKTSANSAKLNAACGLILFQDGSVESDPAKRLDLFRRALLYDDKAIQIHPTYKGAWLNRGVVNLYLKNYDAAVGDSRRVLQMAPEDRKASANLSLALCAKGKAYGETSDFPKALRLLNESYQADPSNQEAIWFLGIFSGKSGDHEEAVRWHAKFTEIRPNDPAAWKGLEWAYDLAGDLAKGAECRARAAQLNQKPPQ